ncbi:MAG: hypothetical protein RL647_652 [Bacteroidota bacterium]|jgi:hypothetical protein
MDELSSEIFYIADGSEARKWVRQKMAIATLTD